MKTKLLSILSLIILTCLCLFGLTACQGSDTNDGEGSKPVYTDASAFVFDNGTIKGLTDYGKTLTEIIIPNKINDIQVTSIGEEAFAKATLTSVVIPDGVTTIGNYAFAACERLASIVIPNTVTNINSHSFVGCINIESATLPISALADISTVKIKTVVINGGTSIRDHLFEDCRALTSIVIPNSVTSIGDYAFRGCISLTNVTISNSVTSIGNFVFGGCSSLTNVVIPDSVTNIGQYAFHDCDSLNYNVKDNLKYLGNSSNPYLYLAGTTSDSISSATIDNNCKFIGDYAFAFFNSLTSVVIPNSVTSIGNGAFDSCNSLATINFNGTVNEWNNVAKYSEWDYNVPATKVICSDGEVEI